MNTPRRVIIGATSLAVLALAGCSFNFSFGNSADPEKVEAIVVEKLLEVVPDAQTPVVDCGSDSLAVEVGKTHICALSVPGTEPVYDVTLTITEVDGSDFLFDIEVAEEPR